ncbi:ABC transporter ATP-binding protein [Cereibacter sp. SYSU M97828]|nr:ABC transporter ATP-binding protein [Cereibacter flavus]
MASIDLTDVTLSFGGTRAVDRVSLSVPSGAFFSLLGPSGCGKTTLLRLIAGLERPEAGRIAMDGRVVAEGRSFVEPGERDLGMVFQSYALWPHMTVAANVAFGLEMRRIPAKDRVAEALAMVGLSHLADRRPHQLSGGQRQRVALARSLAVRPRLILLDEPLANLDAHLRQSMLAEFRRIHRQSGTTFVFVTHDQNEAMAISDLVAVMDAGRLQQVDSPQALFDRPASAMVARFVGAGRTVPVDVLGSRGGQCDLLLAGHRLSAPGDAPPGPGWLCLHARDLAIDPAGIPAEATGQRFENGMQMVHALLADAEVDIPSRAPVAPGAIRIGIAGGWVIAREGAPACHLSVASAQ